MNEQGKKSKSFLHCFESQVILPIKYAPPGQYFDIGWQSSNILTDIVMKTFHLSVLE